MGQGDGGRGDPIDWGDEMRQGWSVRDTSEAARRRYFELLRRQSPAEKMRTVVALTNAARRLALAGIRERHPNLSPAQERCLLAERLYGAHGAAVFGRASA